MKLSTNPIDNQWWADVGEVLLEKIEEYRALIHSYHQIGVGGLSTIKENNNMIISARSEMN